MAWLRDSGRAGEVVGPGEGDRHPAFIVIIAVRPTAGALALIEAFDQAGILLAAGALDSVHQGIPAVGEGPVTGQGAVARVGVAQILPAGGPELEEETLEGQIGMGMVVRGALPEAAQPALQDEPCRQPEAARVSPKVEPARPAGRLASAPQPCRHSVRDARWAAAPRIHSQIVGLPFTDR